MKHLGLLMLCLLALCLLIVSCSPQAAATRPAQPPQPTATATGMAGSATDTLAPSTLPSAAQAATVASTPEPIEAVAWVDNPEPSPGETILVSGSLIKSGLYLGGLWMTFTWPQGGQTETFSSLVSYGRGRCPIVVRGFEPGQPVPVAVSVDYQGRRYAAQTSFTPK